jgi:MFS family permease
VRDTIVPLATTLGVQALVSMSVLTIPVVAPAASADIAIPVAYVGMFVALVYGAGMLSSLGCGELIRKLGAIRVSQLCLVLCTLGLFAAAAGTPPFLILSALLMGAGYGPVTPASSHLLARTTPPRMMSLVFSLKQTGVPVGGALAGAVVPLLVGAADWRRAVVCVGIACAAMAVITQVIRGRFDADREPARALGMGSVIRPLRVVTGSADVRRLALCSFVFSSLQLCLVTYLVAYLTGSFGYSLVQAGLMLSLAQTAGIVARVGWGALADRTGRPQRVLAGIALGMAAGALATASYDSGWAPSLLGLICVVFGATAIGWNGVYLAEVARLAPAGKAAEATGGALFFTYFGVLVTPPAFGIAVEQGLGYPLAFGLLALPALAAGVWLIVRSAGAGASGKLEHQETA